LKLGFEIGEFLSRGFHTLLGAADILALLQRAADPAGGRRGATDGTDGERLTAEQRSEDGCPDADRGLHGLLGACACSLATRSPARCS
jgi:hypothetical protein